MSDPNHIAILADMSMNAASTRKGARGVGRYARTPKFEAPAARSTRPNTGQGVTFHFAHKALSKRNDVSDGMGTATSASAHQGYIERREAGAELDDKSVAVLDTWSQERGAQEHPPQGGAADQGTKATVEEHGYERAPFDWSADRAGFGTLGSTPVERKEFWKKVEGAERRHGRVQSRIIAELPHEASPEERMKIAVGFCKKLDELGLPYWASIHAPTKKNDARNHHLHIAYSERPARKNAQGEWDFEAVVRKKKPNRTVVSTRPYRQNRSEATRKRDWVKTLRGHYAEVTNAVLETGGYEKRLDPRSYRESGVVKEPTRHLGFKAHAMETFGLDTKVGAENAEKETRWRVQHRTQRWERALAVEDVSGLFSTGLEDEGFWQSGTTRRDKITEGLDAAKLGIDSEIMAERMGLRLGKRMEFLEQEGARLLRKGRGMRIVSASQDITTIDSELAILETREPDVQEVIASLHKQAKQATKKEAEVWSELFDQNPERPALSLFQGMEDGGASLWDIPADGLAKAAPLPMQALKNGAAKAERVSKNGLAQDGEKVHEEQPQAAVEGAQEPSLTTPTTPSQTAVETLQTSPTPAQEIKRPVQEIAAPLPPTPAVQQDGLVAMGLEPGRDQGVLLIGRPTNREEVRVLDSALLAMTNKETRMRAIATRDLVDVLDSGDLRDRANRGWVVLKSEAERRGLDLETGRHVPSKGTDKERAARHRDEYLSTVLEVRQEVVYVQAR